jgi:hypothetical protein
LRRTHLENFVLQVFVVHLEPKVLTPLWIERLAAHLRPLALVSDLHLQRKKSANVKRWGMGRAGRFMLGGAAKQDGWRGRQVAKTRRETRQERGKKRARKVV